MFVSAGEIVKMFQCHDTIWWVVVISVLLSLIQIAPIKLNPWTAIKNFLTRDSIVTQKLEEILKNLNKVDDRFENVENKLNSLEAEINTKFQESKDYADKNSAIQARVRILSFGDDISHGIKLSREHFEQTIRDIDEYQKYCKVHPNFANGIAEQNIKIIKDRYKEGLNDPSIFLDTK